MQYWLANKAPNAADTNNTCNNLSAVGARPRSSARVSYVFLPLSTYSSVFPSLDLYLSLSFYVCLSVSSSLLLRLLQVSQSLIIVSLLTFIHIFTDPLLYSINVCLPISVSTSLCLTVISDHTLALGLYVRCSVCIYVFSSLFPHPSFLPPVPPGAPRYPWNACPFPPPTGLTGPGTLPVFKLIFRRRSPPRVSQHPSIATRRRVFVISK